MYPSKFMPKRLMATIVLALASLGSSHFSWAGTLVISGKTPTWMTATHSFNFQPVLSGAGTRPVSFQVTNKPVWLRFNTLNGRLYGTPSNAYAGIYSGIVISATAGSERKALPAFNLTVVRSDLAPTIAGTPQTSIAVDQSYQFQPSARDQESEPMSFSIQGKPSWLAFSPTTGRLSGIPRTVNAGTSAAIVITVSDGRHSTALKGFTITVIKPVVLGKVTLSWSAPAENVDGSPLLNLAGYRVHYGTDPTRMTQRLEMPGAASTTVNIEELAAGTYFFAVKAYNTDALESEFSEVLWKTIG